LGLFCSTFAFTIPGWLILSNAIYPVMLAERTGLEVVSLRRLSHEQPEKRE
jgi:hypothetical protein